MQLSDKVVLRVSESLELDHHSDLTTKKRRPGSGFLIPLLITALAGLIIGLAVGLVHIAALSSSAASGASSVRILHINDHHSHITEEPLSLQVPPAAGLGDDITSVNVAHGGMARLVTLFNQLSSASAEPVVKLHAGDAITGTIWYSLYAGEIDAALMNMICFDAFVLGNHEFDDGDAVLDKFLEFLRTKNVGGSVCAGKTPVLAANVIPGATSPLGAGFSGRLAPFTIVETSPGERLGIIGIVTRRATLFSSSPDEGTTLVDEIATARRYIDVLASAGVNRIVLLTHMGLPEDRAIAAALPDVDVIIGGHSHSLIGDEDQLAALGFRPDAPYPELVRHEGRVAPTCIVQAWQHGSAVGNLLVDFDADGDVVSCSGEAITPIGRAFTTVDETTSVATPLPEAEAAKLSTHIERQISQLRFADPDAVASAFIANRSDNVSLLENTTAGTFAREACHVRFPGQPMGLSEECRLRTYERGSEACNMVAQSFLQSDAFADVAIQNGGGCRAAVPAGVHTKADAFRFLPFVNYIENAQMNGSSIVRVLEDALANAIDFDGGSRGSYPYASGLRFDVFANASAGERIRNAQVQNRRVGPDGEPVGDPAGTGTWEPLEMAREYKVITQTFLTRGGDGFLSFQQADFSHDGLGYAEAWINWIEKQGEVQELSEVVFSTQHYINPDGCDHRERQDCSWGR